MVHPIELALAGVVALGVAFAIHRIVRRYDQCFGPGRTDNGVRVGAPKVYDNRTLSLMLEELQGQLRALENIDGDSLKGAIGSAQGTRSSDVSATAGIDVSKANAPKPGAAGSGSDGDAAAGNATAGTSLPTSSMPLKWSERSADLLDDQINLQYQIFNLRLLLERAISDRLTQDFSPRLQTVVALPISIDTPGFAVGCSAIVEVRFSIDIAEDSPATDPLALQISLVALFPQEESYNTLSGEHRGAQGSGRAAYGSISVSGTGSRSTSSSYIRRGADLIAIEREPTAHDRRPDRGEPLIVAWEFRPGAGESSVKSGLRQVMAVLALPQVHAKRAGVVTVNVEVRSFWRRWNATTATTADRAGWRPLFTNRPVRHAFGSHGRVNVPLVGKLDACLAPQITSIVWYRVGKQHACVTLRGHNFFTGTTAIMGGTTISAGGGLTIKSEETLELFVPLEALLDDALLNGRYGASLVMEQISHDLQPLAISGVWIEKKPGGGSYELSVAFKPRNADERVDWNALRRLQSPVFALGGIVSDSELLFDQELTYGRDNQPFILARAMVNPGSLGASLLIAVRWPFCGADWSLRYEAYNSTAPIVPLRADREDEVVLLLCGPEFDTSVSVMLEGIYKISDNGPLTWASDDASDVIRLQLPRDKVEVCQQLAVIRQQRATELVPIPPRASTAAAAGKPSEPETKLESSHGGK